MLYNAVGYSTEDSPITFGMLGHMSIIVYPKTYVAMIW